MTVYEVMMHYLDASESQKGEAKGMTTAEAKHLANKPKFQAGLEREKKRMAKLRREFGQDTSTPAGPTNGNKAKG